jgi:hypothetical protein
METYPEPRITEADLTALNQRALLRTIELARRAATVLLILAAVLALAWLWQILRQQGVLQDSAGDESGFVFVGRNLTFKQRIDAFTAFTTPLGYSALVFGLGTGLRLYCDVAMLRAGASLTGWQVGDPIDPIDDSDEG